MAMKREAWARLDGRGSYGSEPAVHQRLEPSSSCPSSVPLELGALGFSGLSSAEQRDAGPRPGIEQAESVPAVRCPSIRPSTRGRQGRAGRTQGPLCGSVLIRRQPLSSGPAAELMDGLRAVPLG